MVSKLRLAQHLYYSTEYSVDSKSSALEHAEVIMSGGTYRRSVGDETVEVHKVYKVKVCGPDLGSEYLDEFKRT